MRRRCLYAAAACAIALLGMGGAARAAGVEHAPPLHGAGAARTQGARYPPGTVVELHRHTVRVTIHNFAFQPARLVVSPGTRIVWTNGDSDPHTVDSTTNLWASDALDTGDHFARVFARTGTFPYYCSVHPFMHGTIIVKK